ncbi:MAG: peptidyl-prolyl cis-trans isomerase [Candidatus Omnitrophica bacterium]|nr:peptidyl-prolyl cis-trans isomerase [Candidatus Omnitrophota bacterium]
MLNILRHKGISKKILWVIAVIIILSFGVFGTAWRMDNSVNSAGKMYGRSVSIRDFNKAYLDSRDQAIMLYGDQFFKLGNRLNLESEAWDRLLLLREAKKRGLKTFNEEVVDFIAAVPFFQRNGKFEPLLYQAIVENAGVFDRTVHDFEEGIRTQLTIKKLLDQVAVPSTLTEQELKKEYTLRNEKIKLTYALFEPLKAAEDLTVTEVEVTQYYDKNKELFHKPVMVNVEYAALSYPDKATDAQKEDVKKEVVALAREPLKADSDFNALAQKHKIQLKESGLFSQSQPLLTFAWSPELVDRIFSMKQGQYSPVIEAPDGWEVLKIKERQESSIPPLEQIKPQVKNALLTDRGFGLAQTKADAALKNIQEGLKANKSFKELAEAAGAKVDQAPPFGRGEYQANRGLLAEFQEETLKMNMQNRLSAVITTTQGPAIIYLDSTEPVDQNQFEADKENFRQMMIAQRRSQAIIGFLTQLKFEANVQSNVERNRQKR